MRPIDADALLESLKNFTYAEPCTDFQRGVNAVVPLILSEIKHFHTVDVAPIAETTREIFEEIEKAIEKSKYNQYTPFGTEERYNPYAIIKQIAELKKKYTEDGK